MKHGDGYILLTLCRGSITKKRNLILCNTDIGKAYAVIRMLREYILIYGIKASRRIRRVKPRRDSQVNRAPSLQPKMTRRISGIKKRTDIHFCTSVRCFYEIDLSPLCGYAPVRL